MKRILTLLAALLLVATAAFGQDAKRFGIKSGLIKTQTAVMGQTIVTTTWFDDYGLLQLTKTRTNLAGMTLDMGSLVRDGKNYAINYGDKTVEEVPLQMGINFLNPGEEDIQKYKIVEEGTESVCGKDCVVYSAQISQRGQTAKIRTSVWEGIPMKTVTETMGMSVTADVIEIQEVPVEASLFEIPVF